MLIGRRLSGRYKIIEVIGGGGMANVYLARDVILERDVAIKVLRLDFSNDEEFIKRFRREAHAATSLAHPNIVSIYDIGEEDDIYYIVMEYVAGQTLKQYIQQHAPLNSKKALDIMKQLGSAISHAHHNQIIHRDIKPQNILIDANGIVKVTDFGIAVALSSTTITQTNSVLGSVHYLSPEQARGGMATRKSDIYSLGIVFFELITGMVPFQGESAVSIALKHLQSETPSPRRWNANIPQSVENIILKATAKDPFYRYETVDELEDDLATALDANRINERKFMIPVDDEVTKAIPIIKDPAFHTKNNETLHHEPLNHKSTSKATGSKPKKKSKLLVILLSIFSLLAIAGIASVTIIPSLFLPDDVKVPDVTDMEYEEAVKLLLSKDFEIGETIKKPSDDIKEGNIIRTNPKANVAVKEGSKITLYQSSGKKKVEFGDYVGKLIGDVEESLVDKGFKIQTKKVFDESEPGTILSQSIKKGEEVIPEEVEVTFEISDGKETINIPDFSGYNTAALDNYAKEAGITIDYSKSEYSDTVAEGFVISQEPKPSTKLEKGTLVKVIISKGKEPMPDKTVVERVPIPYTPKNPGEKQRVKIMIQDKVHSITDIYEEFEITEPREKELTFIIAHGEVAKYIIFVDDQMYQDSIPYPN